MVLHSAQVSLEFLLVLLGFAAVFAALLPFYVVAYNAGVFALDSMNAKRFVNSVEGAVLELDSLGNGSSIAISASPSLKWKIFSEKNELFVSVQPDFQGKEKTFKAIFPDSIGFLELEFDSKKSFALEKINGKILFKNLD
ncbi:MAG: hypothetical protein PHD95_02120 [Candidatus ainarchaeum sp.]|nr:hypothetical protein [Candidatus ainarchaeum sp.]